MWAFVEFLHAVPAVSTMRKASDKCRNTGEKRNLRSRESNKARGTIERCAPYKCSGVVRDTFGSMNCGSNLR